MKKITIAEAAAMFGVHVDTLRDWEQQGLVVPSRTPGGHRRYDVDELEGIMDRKPKLTLFERQVLINQYETMLALSIGDKVEIQSKIKALYEGYEDHYFSEGLDPKTLLVVETQEVQNILTMFRDLQQSYDALKVKPDFEPESYRMKFQGFDLNCEMESKLVHYVAFFLKTDNYFDEDGPTKFKDLNIKNTNSHYPMLDCYRKMYRKWKKISSKRSYAGPPEYLTAAEINFIVDYNQ